MNTRAFYYWKTVFKLSPAERTSLNKLNAAKLYVRFFDVIWDDMQQAPAPAGPIIFNDSLPKNITVVPVVYITNESLKNCKDENIPLLASNIRGQVSAIANAAGITFNELQLDCDWSGSTREKYFTIIKQIGDYLHQQKKQLSATIRLHQIKYHERTGLPPVDRGMLMFYNMGELNAWNAKNSIYDAETAARYASFIKSYPLPLDVVLPAFGWVHQIRDGKIIRLLNESFIEGLTTDSLFKKIDRANYQAKGSFFLHGEYFMKNDLLKIESVPPDLCLRAARQVEENLKREPRSVALFDINSLFLLDFNEKNIEEIFSRFN